MMSAHTRGQRGSRVGRAKISRVTVGRKCQRERLGGGDAGVGALIMLGALLGLIVLIFGVVVHFDPEARPSKERDR